MAYVSVVLPVYNEASRLEKSVNEVVRRMDAIKLPYELIIAEDGSTDGTYELAKKIADRNRKIKVLHSEKKLGRGLALKRSFSAAKGDVLCYIDADMATDPSCIKELVGYGKGNDVAIGSRHIKGAVVERPFIRIAVSRFYYWALRIALDCDIYDFQCGFKSFSRRYFENEIMHIKETGWPWDTIAIINALKKGYSVKEFPVTWKETRSAPKNLKFMRLLDDAIVHGRTLLRLFMKWRLRINIEL